MVGGAQRVDRVGAARGVHAGAVSEEGAAPRLVEGDPVRDAVAQGAGDDARVVGEPLGGVPVRPAARVLQGLRQVPVVQREGRRDAVLQQVVHQRPVEVEPLLHGRSAPGRLHPRPGHGEAVRVDAEPRHHPHVLGPAVVVVGGGVTGVTAAGPAGRAAEGVPDGRAAAVLPGGALDLVGGGGGAPQEAGRKTDGHGPLPRVRRRGRRGVQPSSPGGGSSPLRASRAYQWALAFGVRVCVA